MDWTTVLCTFLAIFASSGFWSFVQARIERKDKEKDDSKELLVNSVAAIKALLHDRLYCGCLSALDKGFVTPREYKNLAFLYDPYRALHGNGMIEKMFEGGVKTLPIRGDNDE